MAYRGIAVTATSLLAALTFGVAGCGSAQVAQDGTKAATVDVAAALGVEGLALAAWGLDPAELDLLAEPAASATPSPQAGEKGKRGERLKELRQRRQARVQLGRNGLHGEAVVQTKDGTKTVVVQRGEVTAIDGDSATVKSTDGFTLTWKLGDQLRVVERRTTVKASDVKVGTKVNVAGAKDGDASVARLIVVPIKQK
ncbi:hypothetical protein TPA0907_55240 [Micromonospora humidisoli]|uniref:DUF5666 domain-containing protein n=1 Tax=Micromonospora humidisoli TaxID=2807622 RepID=A0ABS2J8X6_9ACTN|nr:MULTISPECIES: hypothetical protein [Micromonospora]MBM7083007.1 hypothetical protein [Micromonospora humidisoli]GHJ11157.1 hypothetical protein TPA0907_55240 [Micromonospora sp. AKA109]